MYQGKYAARKKKLSALLLCLLLVLSVSVGGTLAYIVTQTEGVTNIFNPARVSTRVEEVTEGNVKSNVRITNTGDTEAYIRAAVIINWVDANGDVYASVPDGCVTDPAELTVPAGWSKKGDYYYYDSIVPAGKETSALIDSIEPGDNVPDGYYLQVTILSSGVQANPKDAVEAAWGFVPGTGNKEESQ